MRKNTGQDTPKAGQDSVKSGTTTPESGAKVEESGTMAAGEKPFNQLAYQNDFIREKYDRVNLTLPKGKKTIVKQRAAGLNKSVNEYINDLITADLKAAEPKKYYYGMRLRGFSIGCQPDGVLERIDDPKGRYHDIIVYDHRLSDNDVLHFSLDYLENGTD